MHSKNQKRHVSPVPSRSPVAPMKPKAPAVAPAVTPSPGDTLAFRVPKDYPHSRFSKAPLAVYPPKGARNKTCVSLPVVSLEKMPCLNRAGSASHVRITSSSPSSLKPQSLTPPASQRSSEKLTNGRGTSGPSTPRSTTSPSSLDGRPSPARSPLDRRPPSTPSPSTLDRKPSPSPSPSHRAGALLPSSPLQKKQQNGTKTSSRSQKRLSGRVFDPNKHCGVQDPETKRPCTRSLTCKTHSLTHRRAVPGRRKHFDILLAEHKGRAKEKEKDRDATLGGKEGSSQSITSQETPCPSKPQCQNGRSLSTLKLRLANAHIPRVPGSSSSTSSPLPSAPAPAPAPNPEPSPHSWVTAAGDGSRLSSDEGDAETQEDTDRPAFRYSSHHPQPLGFCMFSSRLMGRGHYVFDRRWDRMRLALQNMVEKHLNAQMWRKVPLAAESLLSSSGTSPVSSVTSPLLSSPSNSLSYTATFSQSASMAGVFSIRDAAQPIGQVSTPGKARNGTHKASRPSKDIEDSVGSKKRKNSPYSSSTSFPPSSSSLFPTVDNHKRNGSSYHPILQSSGGISATTPARKKGLGRGGSTLWSSRDDWLSRAEGSQSHSSQNSRELGTTSIPHSPNREPASSPHQPLAPPSGPLAYGGGAEGRKRRSPSSYRGKASKLSRPGGLESLCGSGSDSGGILASGPESPRQVMDQLPWR
ncbi:ataxin-7-like protein 1 isoform X1 [Micropterus dolomieu]|uniref:ataxin-7-like protein 1 isoform X1 n=1 Tax=Micropterus dolomieu TaxID=147949 RepID=UPI001E8EAB77|nr:ataxin-7-like protein 1 isoform X1 [Micropterus dolomieu]XP_045928203.1 ataxin-7-like protein 1 isoform X1 [Micropterus dolomieu]XP_045928204.1 ataxin-7-like protein 1 isoform X1 [Micropterus dolomieu]